MTTTPAPGSWRSLFTEYRGIATVFAAGVLLFATNVYVTTSLLPSAVEDIGGHTMFAWVMTSYLLAGVVASTFVSRLSVVVGARRLYLIGFALFGVGSVLCAVAPAMWFMLVARVIQGLGGGFLAGAGYVTVRGALPPQLWGRAIAVMSSMWGVGNVAGPLVGGLFAQLGQWRGAFWLLAAIAAASAVVARRSIPGQRMHRVRQPAPLLALVLLTAATTSVAVASITETAAWRVGLVALAILLIVALFMRERHATQTIWPKSIHNRRHVLPWLYGGVAALAIASTVETFVPLLGQDLAGMGPFVAGLLGAAISWGWTTGQIITSTATRPALVRRIRIYAPLVLAVGLAGYGALQVYDPSGLVIGLWFVLLFVAGLGIGGTFGHIATAAMASATDEDEANKASAGINTTQLVANTFGSALAGLLVSIGGTDLALGGRIMPLTFAAVGLLGTFFAVRAVQIQVRSEDQAAPGAQG